MLIVYANFVSIIVIAVTIKQKCFFFLLSKCTIKFDKIANIKVIKISNRFNKRYLQMSLLKSLKREKKKKEVKVLQSVLL